MLWRHKRNLLHTTRMTEILNSRLLHLVSPPQPVFSTVSDRTHNLFSAKHRKFPLTAQFVHSTLLSCPSDLIALSFFIWCAKQHNYFHDNRAFNHMVCVVARLTDRYENVKTILLELESVGLSIKAQTFLILLRIYWRGGMYAMVFEVFEQMGSFGFMPNTFARNVVMDVLFKMGQADTGIKVLKETLLPNFLSFSIALCNLCRLKDVVGVKDVLRMMLREQYYPNVNTFEAVLNCLIKEGRLMEAFQVLGLMVTLGISVSVNVWTMLLDGFCRLNQPVMAGSLLEKMVQIGCSPTIVTYTVLFKGYIESQMLTGAFDILNTMKSKGYVPDLVLVNVLIDSLSKIGRYDDALDVFLSLPKWNLVPDSYTFSSFLSTISISKRFGLLTKLVSQFQIEVDLVVCNSLLNCFCRAGSPVLALELYNEMVGVGFTPDNYSIVALLRGLCGIMRTDVAVNVYNGFIMNNHGIDAYVHTVIIDGLIRNAEYHKAIRLFRKAIVENYQLDVVSYTVAIRGLLKVGRTEEASALYNQMKEIDLSPTRCTYNIMLHGFCKQRHIEMVRKLLEELTELEVQMDSNILIKLTHFLLKHDRSSSSFDHLMKLWNLILPRDGRMSAFVSSAKASERKVGDANPLWKGYVENNQFVDLSSSDDLSDEAASVG